MRSPDDVPIHHLVVDTAGFAMNAPIVNIAAKVYTTEGVVAECKDRETRRRIKALPYELIIREPSTDSIRKVIEFSKKTGDYPNLSVVDLKLLALARDVHIEHVGIPDGENEPAPNQEPIEINDAESDGEEEYVSAAEDFQEDNENASELPQPTEQVSDEKNEARSEIDDAQEKNLKDADDLPKETFIETTGMQEEISTEVDGTPNNTSKDCDGALEEETEEDEVESKEGNEKISMETWVDESNLLEVADHLENKVDVTRKMTVACMTTDYAVQNVLLKLKMNIASINGRRVTKLKTYILRCRICKKLTSVMTKAFCPSCGHQSLHRVAVSVNKDGVQRVYVNWERERSTRGLRYSVPMPKGGKHAKDPIVMEDQRRPQNKMAKCRQDPTSTAPFSMIDVTSKSALLGIRGINRERTGNPNVPQGGRKRGGKKR